VGATIDLRHLREGINAYCVRSPDGASLQFAMPLLIPRLLPDGIDHRGADGAVGVIIDEVKRAAAADTCLRPLGGFDTVSPARYAGGIEPVTPRIEEVLACCDAVVLESNHCPQMLEEGPYPEFLKRRIRSKHGHLSNAAAATCLRDIGGNLTAVVLAHLSEVNNTPEKAVASAQDGLGLLLDGIDLIVGTQHAASEILRI